MSEHARAEPQAEAAEPASAEPAAAASLQGLVTRLHRTAGNRAVVRMLAARRRRLPWRPWIRPTSRRSRPTARQITGVGTFAGKPNGLGPAIMFSQKGAKDNVKPGDIIVRREQYEIEGREKDKDPLNHQCLVASVDRSDPKKPTVTTVNGNGYYQSIHVRTEPLSYHSGYYDSLSETPDKGF